jgi:hypothetical protein
MEDFMEGKAGGDADIVDAKKIDPGIAERGHRPSRRTNRQRNVYDRSERPRGPPRS